MGYFGYVENKHIQNSHLTGTYTLGIIQAGFFLLPPEGSNELGVPVYKNLKRQRRSMIAGHQKWGKDEWAPQRIIERYGPATWAQDGSWGYRTPICMLNWITRLQAVLELIPNKTASALELLPHQQTQRRAAVCQN